MGFLLKSRTGRARNYTELKISSSQKLKGILANSANPCVIIVSKNEGQGDFTTVQAVVNAVPANNMHLVTINIKPGIYKEKVAETPQESAEEIKSYARHKYPKYV